MTSASLRTSAGVNRTRSPSSLAICSPADVGRSRITTFAPASSRAFVVASPRPEAPPVTSATAPVTSTLSASPLEPSSRDRFYHARDPVDMSSVLPGTRAAPHPDHPAVIMAGSGETRQPRRPGEGLGPARAVARRARPAPRRRHRAARRQLRAGVRGVLGRAAVRLGAHGGQPPPHRGRGRLHRARLRRQGAGRRRVAGSARRGRRRGGARGRAPAGVRARRARASTTTTPRSTASGQAARRRARGRGDALLVGHHRAAEGRTTADAAAAHRRARDP